MRYKRHKWIVEPPVGQAVLDSAKSKGLTGRWLINETGGKDHDLSAYRNHALSTAPSVVDVQRGRVRYFDGVSTSSIQAGSDNSLLTPAWSIGCWVRLDPTNTGKQPLFTFSSAVERPIFFCNLGDKPILTMASNSYRYWARESTTLLRDGKWHRALVCCPGDSISDILDAELYIDGKVQTKSSKGSGDAQTAKTSLSFGTRTASSSTRLAGHLDDICSYSRALSPYEALQDYRNSYHNILGRKVWIPSPVSTGIILSIQGIAHQQLSSNLILAQPNLLTIQSSAHPITLDGIDLIQQLILSINNSVSASDNSIISLLQNNVLKIADTIHLQPVDVIQLVQANLLLIAKMLHSNANDNLALAQSSILSIIDLTHNNTADNINLVQANTILIQGTVHQNAVDSIILSSGLSLGIANTEHANANDNLQLVQLSVLAIDSALHSNIADNVNLSQFSTLSISETTHSLNMYNIALDVSLVLNVNSTTHANIADNLSIVQSNIIDIISTVHANSSSNIDLIGSHVLIISDQIHSLLMDNILLNTGDLVVSSNRIIFIEADDRVFYVAKEDRIFNVQ